VHAPTDVAEAVSEPATFDFEAIFRSDYARIARVIVRVIQDPARAEDLAVEAFWRLWRNPQAQGARSGAWLYRTAVRLALDELRRRARQLRYEHLLTFIRSPRTPDEILSSAEEQGKVRAVLAAISVKHGELLLLHSDGCPYDELASYLSINPASVGTMLKRAKTAFRQEYMKRYGNRE
jgi:RNA polymerase sigma-70 factor (ECF subfamily)